jgi:hypothetical protein
MAAVKARGDQDCSDDDLPPSARGRPKETPGKIQTIATMNLLAQGAQQIGG